MKRAPIAEDWSRFNRAVLQAADSLRPHEARPEPMPQRAKRDPAEHLSEPGDDRDTYGLITRHKWRKHA